MMRSTFNPDIWSQSLASCKRAVIADELKGRESRFRLRVSKDLATAGPSWPVVESSV